MVAQRSGIPARKIVGTIFYVLVIGVCLFFGAMVGWIGKSPTMSEFTKQQIFGVPPREAFGNTDVLTVLVLGLDQEYTVNKWGAKVKSKAPSRSDMMLVARMDFANDAITAVSIPRDTLCKLDGYRRQKINAYHALGGPELSKEAVEHLLPGVKIDKTVVLNFDAFAEAVDILGGVTIDVPKKMNYDDNWGNVHIHLEKGVQHLDGYNALMFARFRHSDSDFERQKRQKELLVALKERMREEWTKAPTVVDKSLDVAGNTFDAKQMASLMRFAKGVPEGAIRMGQIPVVEASGTDLKVDESKLEDTLEEFNFVKGPKNVSTTVAHAETVKSKSSTE